MRRIRPLLFWTHLVAGVAAGVVVLVMSVTGVLLTYQKQLTLWADLRGVHAGPPTPGAPRLSPDSLLRIVAARGGKAPSAVVWRSGDDMPVEVSFGRDGRHYLNAWTGEVVGTGNSQVRALFSAVTDWHRWLAMTGTARETGKAITGWSNVAFLVLVLTGLVLWWPRHRTWTAIRQVLWFRRTTSPKARDFNWHNVIGIWSAVPLALIIASGTVISFPWASDLVYRAVGDAPPPRQPESAAGRTGAPSRAGSPAPVAPPSVGDVYAIAAERMPAWQSLSLAWPKDAETPLVFTIDRGMGGEPTKRATLTISRTGAPLKYQPFDSLPAGRRARTVMRFTHTGEVLGFWGQTLAGLVSLGAAVLVCTGLLLSLRRLAAWRGRRRESPRPPTFRSSRHAEFGSPSDHPWPSSS